MAIIKEVNGKKPVWGKNCYFSENAAIVGDVEMGDDCSVWFSAVLRADVAGIRMGNRVNVQDGACVHQSHGKPAIIEDDVSIGHLANVHGCVLRKGALVGMGATVLDDAEVGEGAVIAANALVLQGTKVGANELWAGVPARMIKNTRDGQAQAYAQYYMDIKKWYTPMADVKIEESWKEKLKEEFHKPYFMALADFVHEEYRQHRCFPPAKLIFNAFNLCPFNQVKVVIIGQDPYHGEGQAHGLSFSVNDGIAFPPSLQNIFKEIENDVKKPIPSSGNLTRWAEQGVLLLNATLTVRAHQAGSHQHKGWETFTDAVIAALSQEREHLVFMLWGSYARSKTTLIDKNKHEILESVHPSPLAANKGGWFHQKQFSQANNYLEKHGKTLIEW